MSMELRELDPDIWDIWYDTLLMAFPGESEAPEQRALWRELTEPQRSLGVWDAGQVIGTLSAFSLGVSVPGGAVVPAAGLTLVGVLPTHRRRGVLTRMMRRHLDDVHEAGVEPLAVLTASEPEIYGRFGYGTATWKLSTEINTDRVRLLPPEGYARSGAAPAADGIQLRMVDSEAALPRTEEVYARQVVRRPGMLERRPGWEALETIYPSGQRGGRPPQGCVLAERDGAVEGYTRYTVEEVSGRMDRVRVHSLEADSLEAYTALLRFLFSIDLASSVTMQNRPVDDAWQHLVSDVRACAPTVRENLYARPVEMGAALAARSYSADIDLVIDLADPFCPWNEGRWRLSADGSGAVCERTSDSPDLSMTAREVGAAYLGGTSLAVLHRAGRVTEATPGAVSAASRAFGSDIAPWLPHGF